MATKKSPRSKARSSKRATAPKAHSKRWSGRKSKKQVSGAQSAHLTGSFAGDIQAAGHLHIASGAKCRATVRAASVQVDGNVKGRLVARDRMKLGSKSNIQGEIIADKLVTSDGAAFHGTCRLGKIRAA